MKVTIGALAKLTVSQLEAPVVLLKYPAAQGKQPTPTLVLSLYLRAKRAGRKS